MLDVQEKINNLFSDDIIEDKRIVYSPNKQIPSKYNSNLPDNQINIFNKNEKSMEMSNNKNTNTNTKRRKKHIKRIKDNLKNEGNVSYDKIHQMLQERHFGFSKLKNDYFITSTGQIKNNTIHIIFLFIEKENRRK